MTKQTFNINTSEVVELTNKLEKMHRSAMPVAVRGSLNDAAFDMKKNQVEQVFKSRFTTRKKNFIRSHTVANKSKNTFNINEMKSEVGVIKGKSDAGDQLEKQEFGGTIANRDFIPMDPARIGKNKKKLVSRKNYLKAVKVKKAKNLVRAAAKAGKGNHILYNYTLFQVKGIRNTRRKTKLRLLPIYSFKSGRNVQISKQPFLKPAGENSAKKIPDFFIQRAKNKLMKK
jgi:hypothetical protein